MLLERTPLISISDACNLGSFDSLRSLRMTELRDYAETLTE